MSHTIFGTAHLGQARCICPTNPDGCPLHQRPYTRIEAPDRSVCQHSGDVRSPDPDGYIDPSKAVEALLIGSDFTITERALLFTKADYDVVVKQRDDAIAELSNMIDLTIQVGRLGDYLKHAIADRDDYREQADEWHDRYQGAQVRMDEMSERIRELEGGAK